MLFYLVMGKKLHFKNNLKISVFGFE